jgi:hypothetical protein
MTQAEFIAYVQIPANVVNVNIWYTQTAPYTILGITIPTLDANQVNITPFLDQVQELTIPIEIAGIQQDITLVVNTREVHSTLNGNFYFFLVDPYLVTSITVPSFIGINASVSLTPAIDGNIFNESPYNILQGLAENIRKSNYIMFSDRYKVGTLALPAYTGPTNIDALLSGSAEKADVQDSLYSDTGWTNARYEGTKTNNTDYRIDSAVSGKIFSAAEYPLLYDTTQIAYQVSQSLVIYSDYFYTGLGDSPGFNSDYIDFLAISGSNYDENSSIFYIKHTTGGNPGPLLPALGETIAFQSTVGTTLGTDFEVVQVIGAFLHAVTPIIVYGLEVTRRYGGTPNSTIVTPIDPQNNCSLFTIQPTQLYELTGNKVVGLTKGLLLVEDTGKLLTIDDYGYVLSST